MTLGPARAPVWAALEWGVPAPHRESQQLTCWIWGCLSVRFPANLGLAVIRERYEAESEQAAC